MKKKNQNITVHIPVTMLSSIWKGDFQKLPANQIYQLIIDYPLDKPAVYLIKTGKKGMGLIALLSKIGKLYQKTYDVEDESEAGRYGIYGHSIDDLNLTGIRVNHKTKKIILDVNS